MKIKPKQDQDQRGFYLLLVAIVFTAVIFMAGVFVWQERKSADQTSDAGRQTLEPPSEVIVDMSNWQTYENKEFAYAIKYRQEWAGTSQTKYNYVDWQVFKLPHHNESSGGFSVGVMDNQSGLSLADFLDDLHDGGPPSEIFISSEKLTVNDLDGMGGEVVGPGALISAVTYFASGDYVYELRYNLSNSTPSIDIAQERKEFEQILTTFRLSDQTADWQSYTNSELGISIQYSQPWYPHLVRNQYGPDYVVFTKSSEPLPTNLPATEGYALGSQFVVHRGLIIDVAGVSTAQQYIDKMWPDANYEKVKINGLEAIKIVQDAGGASGKAISYSVFRWPDVYTISHWPYDPVSMDTTSFLTSINTFKFTDQRAD